MKSATTTDLHYRYSLGIVVGLSIIGFSMRLSSDSTTVNFIGFAATLASLLLSIIAIFYAFITNNSLSSASGVIGDSAKNIATESARLEVNLKGLEKWMEGIPVSLDRMERKVENLATSAKFSTPSPVGPAIAPVDQPHVQNAIDLSSWVGLKALYTCVKAFEAGVPFDLQKATVGKEGLFYSYGYLIASVASQLLNITVNGTLVSVHSLHPALKEEVDNRIEISISTGSFGGSLQMKSEIDSITSYIQSLAAPPPSKSEDSQ